MHTKGFYSFFKDQGMSLIFTCNISCLVYYKRGTESFTWDYVHTSEGCSMMFAVGVRQIFIINVCLSCLPSCLHLHYCEQLEKTAALQNQVPDFPWCFTAQKKNIINSPLSNQKGTPREKRELLFKELLWDAINAFREWDMKYTLKYSKITDLRGSSVCCRIKIWIKKIKKKGKKKIKENKQATWTPSLGCHWGQSQVLYHSTVTKVKAKCHPERERGISTCPAAVLGKGAGGRQPPTS